MIPRDTQEHKTQARTHRDGDTGTHLFGAGLYLDRFGLGLRLFARRGGLSRGGGLPENTHLTQTRNGSGKGNNIRGRIESARKTAAWTRGYFNRLGPFAG